MMAAAFIATFVFDINVVFIILAAVLVGIGRQLWTRRKERAA